ncbi:hypothetical protein ABTZ98_17000 [Streptomyces bacillaris]|nr:hypothetical protein GA0115244_123815 [Streptomyces sp. DvalAA-19]
MRLRGSQGIPKLPQQVLIGRCEAVDILVHGATQCRWVRPTKTIEIFDPYTFIVS